MGILFVALCVILAGSLVQALRGRARVRAMLREPDGPEPRACAIPTQGAQRFFDETRMLRAAVEERLAMPLDGAADFIHADVDPAVLAGQHVRRVADWVAMYGRELDDLDRAALEQHGVNSALIQKMALGANVWQRDALRRFLADVKLVEERMATPARTAIYR